MPKAKSPGFWFFTGDWMKDPELRFCSLFARGLLIDLLCLMFESKRMGYLCRPDGGPRDDDEIVNAISGGSHENKISALEELENSGVLSRDSCGILYSRRLVRLAEISQERSNAGKQKGKQNGSKTEANIPAKRNQKVGVSVSDSVSDTFITSNRQKTEKRNPIGKHPTVEQVREFCLERKNGLDAEAFVDYYAAQGWKLSNGRPLKDWQAAVRKWERSDKTSKTKAVGRCLTSEEIATGDYWDYVRMYEK